MFHYKIHYYHSKYQLEL